MTTTPCCKSPNHIGQKLSSRHSHPRPSGQLSWRPPIETIALQTKVNQRHFPENLRGEGETEQERERERERGRGRSLATLVIREHHEPFCFERVWQMHFLMKQTCSLPSVSWIYCWCFRGPISSHTEMHLCCLERKRSSKFLPISKVVHFFLLRIIFLSNVHKCWHFRQRCLFSEDRLEIALTYQEKIFRGKNWFVSSGVSMASNLIIVYRAWEPGNPQSNMLN